MYLMKLSKIIKTKFIFLLYYRIGRPNSPNLYKDKYKNICNEIKVFYFYNSRGMFRDIKELDPQLKEVCVRAHYPVLCTTKHRAPKIRNC